MDLSRLFSKWLQLYAEQVLSSGLPDRLTTPINVDEICTILNTADYCLTTTTQLEDRIKAKVDEPLRDNVSFDSARESFILAANLTIKALVRKVELDAELSFREMVNTNWATVEHVGDHSGYVDEMVRSIIDAVTGITAHGHVRERYIRTLSDRVVEWFGGRFIDGIIQCRPISEAGAEQMLLDVYILKKGLLELPVLGSDTPVQAPALYVKFVNKTFAKIETILKVILTTKEPPAELVQNYFFLIADKSTINFLKVLELKVPPSGLELTPGNP